MWTAISAIVTIIGGFIVWWLKRKYDQDDSADLSSKSELQKVKDRIQDANKIEDLNDKLTDSELGDSVFSNRKDNLPK